jgi:hypothetical protein
LIKQESKIDGKKDLAISKRWPTYLDRYQFIPLILLISAHSPSRIKVKMTQVHHPLAAQQATQGFQQKAHGEAQKGVL